MCAVSDENASPQAPVTARKGQVRAAKAAKELEVGGCPLDQLMWKLAMAQAAQEKAEREADRCKQQVQLKEEEVRGMLEAINPSQEQLSHCLKSYVKYSLLGPPLRPLWTCQHKFMESYILPYYALVPPWRLGSMQTPALIAMLSNWLPRFLSI
jgi:hypothetical protein